MPGHTTQNQPNPTNSTNHFIFVLRHGLRKVFRPLFITKIVSSLARPGKTLPLPWRSSTYIAKNRRIRVAGIMAVFLLALLSVATVAPLTKKTEYTEAAKDAVQEDTTTISVATSGSATLDVAVQKIGGTFASSDTSGTTASFNVQTNNYTGYTLTLTNNSDGTLVNSENANSSNTKKDKNKNRNNTNSTHSTIITNITTSRGTITPRER